MLITDVKEESVAPPPLPPRHKPNSQSTVTACPSCYCLNEKNVTKCVACGTLLTKDQQTLPGAAVLSNQQTGNNMSNRPVQSLGQRSQHLPGTPAQFSYANQTYESHVMPHVPLPGKPVSSTTTSSFPGIPDQKIKQWECSHCTFHNDMGTKICAVCSKTTDNPVEVQSENVVYSRSAPSMLSHAPVVSSPANVTPRDDAVSPRPMGASMAYDPMAYNPSSLRSAQTSSENDPVSPRPLTSPSYIKVF